DWSSDVCSSDLITVKRSARSRKRRHLTMRCTGRRPRLSSVLHRGQHGRQALAPVSLIVRRHMLPRAMLLFAFLPAMVFGSDFTPGENLITPFEPSVYDGYTEYIKKESGYTSYLWQSDEHGFDDHYVVNVVKGKRDSLRTFRSSQDAPGKRSCKGFKSEVLVGRSRNGYLAELWQTTCELKEMRITTI